jgi:FAD/FMN-containing dehydrogenase
MVRKYISHTKYPFSEQWPFQILIETSGSNQYHDEEKVSTFLERLFDSGFIQDGVVAQDNTQIQSFWSLRESIPEASTKCGAVLKYDISLPLSELYDMVTDMKHRLSKRNLYCEDGNGQVPYILGYGHMGDGNLHLNICAKTYSKDLIDAVEPFIYEWTEKHMGSISAEHGLGQMKGKFIGYSKSPEMIDVMRDIKKLFDPKGIMNPYKFLE